MITTGCGEMATLLEVVLHQVSISGCNGYQEKEV
jgi:hypothetical protein